MNKFETIDKARKILGLGEEASRDEIKTRYLELMKKYHPDKTSSNEKYLEKTKNINWAYGIISSYCDDYKIPFTKEEIERINPDLKLNEQFGDDWLAK